MNTLRSSILCALLACWLSACGVSAPPPPSTLAPTPLASGVPTSTRTAVPTPLAISKPNVQTKWPPELKNFVPASARVVDFSEVDTDGDGVNEMLVIYQDGASGRGLVIRREGANGRAYALGGDKPVELFQESWTGNTVRDINADGKIEIMIEGVVKGTATTVSVFQWNGAERAYATLLSLTGSEGVAIDDPQARDIFDFTALQLLFQRSAIMRATHAEWNKTAYDIKSEVLFLLGTPNAFNYAEEVALAYYVLLDKDEPEQMYALLTEPQKSKTPLKAIQDLSRGVDGVSVVSLKIDDEKSDSATATLTVSSVDHATQKEQSAQHVWRLKKENGQWKLAEER